MSILDKLPPNYRFTMTDYEHGMDIFMKFMELKDVSDEEAEFELYTSAAWSMYCDKKRWPTLSEVRENLRKEAEERETRYFNTLTPKGQQRYLEEKKKKEQAT